MKRSITRWTMAVATAGVLSLPVSGFARTTQDPQPQPQQQQPPAQPQPQQPQPQPEQPAPTPQQPAPTPQQPAPTPQQPTPTPQQPAPTAQPSTQAQADKEMTPQDHLKKAQEAAKEISTMSVPAKNRSDVEQLKKHLANLDKASSSSAATPTETAKKGEAKGSAQANWGTEVAAIDKIITEMVGNESATASSPKPTGTSGSSTKEATTLDDATRAKLMEVRTHITAYAAGMAGTSTPKTEAAATTETPAARPEPSMTQPATQSPAQAAPPAQNPATPSPQQPDPNAAQPPATQPSPANQAPAAQAQPQQMDTEAAHRHLLSARETLAQLTQLPAASQLSGEARNQVSQLITNFNELITTQSNWKSSYDKVSANLTTLLGPDNSDNEAMGGAPTPNAGATPTPGAPGATPPPNAGAAPAPGAVGTAGTATAELDPAIRAKLVELRKNLNDFKKAAGAGGQ